MASWFDGPLVGLDFETTGTDPLHDVPVQVALVWCDGRGGGRTASWLVDPGCDVPDGAVAIHGISGELARAEGWPLDLTAVRVRRELEKAAREAVPIVAMNASFDVTIAAALFARAGLPPMDWDLVIDPLVIDRYVDPERPGKRRLDALCEHYGIALNRAHDAGVDAAAAVALAREIGRRWPEAGRLDPGHLTELQRTWHRSWAESFDEYCRSEGRPPLDPDDYLWPVRCSTDVALAVGA
ncbi:MAG TPA: exonuclease domain-containing protein [Acidimicrobiales bacterium]|nr:exonuclease domain-containing protein [Acidimicrobiales bacterium]